MIKTLKYVHIGEDVWACGKVNNNYQNTGRKHMVIYAPEDKLYHVYDKDVDFICTEIDEYGYLRHGCVNRHGNTAIESNLKIYILTSILDQRENWCFDLKYMPITNKLKVIYDNGTVKNIDFFGEFREITIEKVYRIGKSYTKRIRPVGYRLVMPLEILPKKKQKK